MKTKILFLLMYVISLQGINAQIFKSVLVDFGPNDISNGNITTSPDINGNYWNNATDPSLTAPTIALIDKNNISTGFSLNVTGAMSENGIQNGGLLTPNASILEKDFSIATATEDYFYTGTSGSITIKGLDIKKGYVFNLFGSRNTTETRITKYTLQGANLYNGTLQTSGTNLGGVGINGNAGTVLVTDTIMPDSTGKIKLIITLNTGTFAHLNLMRMDEVNGTAVKPFCPSKDKYHIAVMGSSVPTGWGATNYHGYVYMYTDLLSKRYQNGSGDNWGVTNISVPGNSTIDVLGRWDTDLLPLCSKYVVYALSLGNEGIVTGGHPFLISLEIICYY